MMGQARILSLEECDAMVAKLGIEGFANAYPYEAAAYQEMMQQLELNGGRHFCEHELGVELPVIYQDIFTLPKFSRNAHGTQSHTS